VIFLEFLKTPSRRRKRNRNSALNLVDSEPLTISGKKATNILSSKMTNDNQLCFIFVQWYFLLPLGERRKRKRRKRDERTTRLIVLTAFIIAEKRLHGSALQVHVAIILSVQVTHILNCYHHHHYYCYHPEHNCASAENKLARHLVQAKA